MKLKSITFGNTPAEKIQDIRTKKIIINYLFDNLNLSDYRYILLTNIKKLIYLQKNQHYVSPNFKGFNYLIIFMTLNDKQICVAINRKKLKYQKNNIIFDYIDIIKLNIQATKSIYKGTIFDGKIINKKKKYIFLIQDCYLLMNNKLINTELHQKLNTINSILSKQFTFNSCSNFLFKLNKLYTYDSLEKLITNIIPKITRESYYTQGLIFFPKYSGINIIYVENKKTDLPISQIKNNDLNNINKESINIIRNLTSFLTKRNYSYENNNKKKHLIIKTTIPDVYEVWINNEKQSIAHIPNIKISHYCQNIFKNNNSAYMNCVYYNQFKKWIPLELIQYNE